MDDAGKDERPRLRLEYSLWQEYGAGKGEGQEGLRAYARGKGTTAQSSRPGRRKLLQSWPLPRLAGAGT
jgi:hypothetical protein